MSYADLPSLLVEIPREALAAKDAEIAKLRAEVADLARLRAIEAAAVDMLNFGAHDGPCSHDEDGGVCLLHVATSKKRESALRAALIKSVRP